MRDTQRALKFFILTIWIYFIFTILYLITWGQKGFGYSFSAGLFFLILSGIFSYLIITHKDGTEHN
jgi:hypothetical protein